MASPGRFYSKLSSNVIYNQAGPILVALIGFFTYPYIIKKLGDSAFGILFITGAVQGYLSFLDLGISSALIKYVSESRARGDTARCMRIINTSMSLNIIMGIAGGVILYVLAPVLSNRVLKVPGDLVPAAVTVFRITALSFFLNMTSSGFAALPQALQNFFLANTLKVAFGVLNFAVMIATLYLGYSLAELVAATTALTAVFAAIYIWISARLVEDYRPRLEFHPGEFSSLIRFGLFNLVNRANPLLLLQVDRFLIGYFISMKAVTYFAVPAIFTGYIMKIPQNVLQVLFPLVSEIQVSHEEWREAIKKIYIRGSKYFLLYNLPLVVLAAVLAKPVLTHWMGADKAAHGALLMKLLMAAYLVRSLNFIPVVILNGIGKPEVNAYILPIAGILNVILCMALIPKYGIEGAGYAMLASMIIVIPVYLAHVQRRFLGVGMREFLGEAFVKPVAAGVVTGAALKWLAPESPGLPALLGICVAYVAVFYGICFLTGIFDREDRERIAGFIGSLSKKR